MSIILQGSTSGSVTLQEPAVAGSTVLDLPATSGTLDRTNRAGNVLQVVQAVGSTQQATTGNTYIDMTNMSVTITPSSASNKILAIVNVNGVYAGQSVTGVQTRLVRGSTSIAFGDCYAGYQATGDQDIGSVVMQILDSPATTSATTYKVQFRSRSGGNEVRVNLNDSPGGNTQLNNDSTNSVITLMEIAA
jgi:hypothetical protein